MRGNGSFAYDPDLGFVGHDSFTYQASDGITDDTATVRLDVHGTASPNNVSATEAVDQSIRAADLYTQPCGGWADSDLYVFDAASSDSAQHIFTRHSQNLVYDVGPNTFSDSYGSTYDTVGKSWANSWSGTWYADGDLRYIYVEGTNARFVDIHVDATVHWGDNTSSAGVVTGDAYFLPTYANSGDLVEDRFLALGTASVSASHTYLAAASFAAHVEWSTVSNALGVWYQRWPVSPGFVSPQVANAALLAYTNNIAGDEGQALTAIVATFTDANAFDPADLYTATIDWGDGTTSTGTVSGSNGNFSVQAAHTYHEWGTYDFTVTIIDKDAYEVAASGTATIADVEPIAHVDSYTTSHGYELVVSSTDGVLANDIGTNTGSLTAVLSSTISHGQLELNSNGAFRYTPGGTYIGSDTFTYRASDGVESSDPATVTIEVTNAEPESSGDTYSVVHDRVLTIDVTANDSDADLDVLTPLISSNATAGTEMQTLEFQLGNQLQNGTIRLTLSLASTPSTPKVTYAGKFAVLSPSDLHMYEWDHRNRLVRASIETNADSSQYGWTDQQFESHSWDTEITYAYDVLNSRIGMQVVDVLNNGLADRVEIYVPEKGRTTLFFDVDGQLLRHNVYANGQLIAVDSIIDGEVVWPLPDRQGTIRDLYSPDSDKSLSPPGAPSGSTARLQRLDYDPFGVPTDNIKRPNWLSSVVDVGYRGLEWDTHVGVYFVGTNIYEPAAGRVMSPNPAGEASGSNAYVFAGNSPVDRSSTGRPAKLNASATHTYDGPGYSYWVNPANDFRDGRYASGATKSVGWVMFVVGTAGAGLVAGGTTAGGTFAWGTAGSYLATQGGISVVETAVEGGIAHRMGQDYNWLAGWGKNMYVNTATGSIGAGASGEVRRRPI